MAREYVIPANQVTLANQAVTLIFFQAMATPPIAAFQILRAFCSQGGSTTSAQLSVQLNTQVSAFPTLVSQAPLRLKAGDPVSLLTAGTAGAAGTSGINASAEGAGTKTVIWPENFNTLNGWLFVPTPDETLIESAQSPAHGFGLHIPTAPASLTRWSGGISFKELS
jgi:hypothetical protein